MNTSRWDPLREMEDLLERYGRARPASASAAAPAAGGRSEHLATADWHPVVDISETPEEYLVEAELPGVKREDVRVGVDEGVLTVQGRRDPRPDAAQRRYHRRERPCGHFARSFALPEAADVERISASFEDGVLRVSIGKLAERRKRGIEVRIE
jgi:HSP20 family protein